MNLPPEILRAIKRKGYRLPTPIQRRALPPALAGHDVVAMARTGSGKTAAFAVPVVAALRRHSPRAGARAVVLSPARELALQTHAAIRDLAKYTDLRVAALVGGDALEHQFAELAANPDVLVATPGRLLHLLSEVPGMSLAATKIVVCWMLALLLASRLSANAANPTNASTAMAATSHSRSTKILNSRLGMGFWALRTYNALAKSPLWPGVVPPKNIPIL